MKQFLLLSLFLLPIFVSAQLGLSRNAVYVEALGLGVVYSINYERQFYLSESLRLGTRIGIAPWHEDN